jgi:3-hydroxyacyl-CoA dehydrogenase
LETKRSLYGRIEKVRKKGSVVSSNTSTLTLANLVEDLPDLFASDFMITHFFNPPRYMRLLEVVVGPKTRSDAVQTIRNFADRRLGKGIVLWQ